MVAAQARYVAVITTPFGRLGIAADENAICAIDFLNAKSQLRAPVGPLARETVAQLKAYLRDPRFRFELPLTPGDTPYQTRVRRALQSIPPGRVLRYGQLAERLRSSARAVGQACRTNPLPIVVPCQRIVARNGIGGFMGQTSTDALHIKHWLLQHECRS